MGYNKIYIQIWTLSTKSISHNVACTNSYTPQLSGRHNFTHHTVPSTAMEVELRVDFIPHNCLNAITYACLEINTSLIKIY